MKRSEQHLQGYRHGWREAIAYVLAEAAEMNDPSAQAALRACAHGMGRQKHESKAVAANAPNNAPQPFVEEVEDDLYAGNYEDFLYGSDIY